MNVPTKFLITLTLSISGLSAWAKSEIYNYRLPVLTASAEEAPKSELLGDLAFSNGAKIKAYSLSIPSALDLSGWNTSTSQALKMEAPLSDELAQKVDAYSWPYGWLFIPKGWKPVAASKGPEGSLRMTFAPNATGDEFFTYHSTGSCEPCADTAGSLLFAKARQAAIKNDASYFGAPPANINSIMIRPTHAAYTIKMDKGLPVEALMRYDTENPWSTYRDIQIRIADKPLATAILNSFVPARTK